MQSSNSWGANFFEKYGIWPIGGGSGNESPPQARDADGNTITLNTGEQAPPPPGENPGEEPPAYPASTSSVDPGRFNQGAVEQGGQPPASQQTNPATGRTYTEEELNAERERVRQQEKDKLYGEITSVKSELQQMREEREAEQRARDEEEARIAEEARNAEESDLDVRELIQRKEQEWNEKFNEVQSEAQKSQALLEQERRFNALKEYKQQMVEQHEDEIMPQLRDMIDGTTEEEIQASVQRAIEKSNSILTEVQSAQQAQRQAVPTTRVTAPGDGGPMEQTTSTSRTFSAEDIAAMSPAEYAKYRDQLIHAAAKRGPYA